MKALLTGFALIIIISVAAWFGLDALELSSQEVYSGPNVRLE